MFSKSEFRGKPLTVKNVPDKLARLGTVGCLLVAAIFLGSPATVKAATRTYSGTGNWNNAGNWGGTIPQNGDDAVIPSGASVTLNIDTNSLLSLSVTGTLTVGNNGTGRTITVTGNVSVASGGTIAPGANNASHTMSIGGNLSNAGTFDGATTAARTIAVTFNGSANQTVSGAGGTTRFNTITLNNSGAANILEITSTNFSAAAGFLTLTKGILKVSGSFSFTNTFFSTAAYAINANSGIWLNNSNVTVTGQTGDPTLSGLLRVTLGTYNVGTAADNDLRYATGSRIDIQGGALNVTGALQGMTVVALSGSTDTITYSQSGGTVTVATVNVSSDASSGGKSFGSFDIKAAASSFTMSAGSIVFQNPTNVQNDCVVGATLGSVTGGTFQFGNASTTIANPYAITTSTPIFNLTIKGTVSAFTELLNSPITIKGAFVIEPAATFLALNQNMSVAGNWTNNGTFTPGTQTTTFNGTSVQIISGSSATGFSGLTQNNSAGLTLNSSASVSGVLTLTSGDITTGSNILTQGSASTSAGTTDVVGNVTRAHTFTSATAYAFGNPLITINFAATGVTPTAMNVNLVKAAPNDFTNAVKRTYSITPTGGTGFSSTLQLRYLDSELNGNTETSPSLQLWKKSGTWGAQGATATDTTNNWVQLSGVTSFSPWVIAGPSTPTDVAMVDLKATRYDTRVLLEWQTGYEVNNIGFSLYREEKGGMVKVTPEPVAGSALIFGPKVSLRAGFAYSWWDNNPVDDENAKYWIEDLDLSGRTAMRGPFFVSASAVAKGPSSGKQSSPPLSAIGKEAASLGFSAPVERLAKTGKPTSAGLAVQAAIASQQAVKLSVKQEGWYRVTQSDLLTAGFPANADPTKLQLFVDGQEVPITVTAATSEKTGKGAVNAWDSIEFYGIGTDSAFTANHVYWLRSGDQNGLRIPQIRPQAGSPVAPSFSYTVERRDKLVYFPSLKNGGGEKFFGPLVYNAQAVDQSVTLQHVAPGAGSATLDVSLQGFTNVPHNVRVFLNGAELGTVSFNGLSKGTAQYNVDQSSLLEGSNQIQFMGPAGFSDITMVEYVRVSYQHSNTADGNAIRFPITGGQQATIDGFTSPAVRVVDATDPNSPQELTPTIVQNGAEFSATVGVQTAGPRTLLAFAADQQKSPAAMTLNKASAWRSAQSADYVAITRDNIANSLQPLINQRARQGLKTAVVDIEDVYDEFSFGNKTPQALKDFFSYSKTSWKKAPRFALLAGDATYDPKNYFGLGDFDLVPTKLAETAFNETATDDWFVDVNDDGVPDIAIGRLPVRTTAEATALVAKIIGYDRYEGSDRVLLVADHNDGSDFEAADTQLQSLIPASLTVTDIRRGQVGDSNARSQLLAAINNGPKFVNFYGHGSTRLWTDGSILTAADAAGLHNIERLALFDAMTCLNGFFHDPTIESLGEALLKAEGGAIAVWASSGMTDPGAQVVMNQQAIQLLLNGSGLTIGEVTAQAKSATGNSDVRRTWVLLGDPATRIK